LRILYGVHASPQHAAVTLLEHGDYECPYCGAAYPIFKEVQARLGERQVMQR
jgi:hypothetical protein